MDEEFSEELEDEKEERDGKSISSDLIRGHINTIILRSLCDGDKYGYEIMAEIERKSHGQYSLKQPSLYSALKRLEKDGYITSYWGGSVGGGRRKYFSLTDEGRAIAEQNQAEWEYSRTIIDSLISDRDFDFSQPAPSAVDMRVLRSSTSRVPSSGDGGEDTLDFDPSYSEGDIERQNEELTVRSAELERERVALEEERSRFEEEMRSREEALRAESEEKEREIAAREEALRDESEEKEREIAEREEALRAESEEKEREIAEREEALRAEAEEKEREIAEREEALRAEAEEKERVLTERERILEEERSEAQLAESGIAEEERAAYNAQLREQQMRMSEERARYESVIREQEERIEAERHAHRLELEEQERRIIAEQEELFRRREQELIHNNYVALLNGTSTAGRAEPSEPVGYRSTGTVDEETPPPAPSAAAGRSDSGYRSVVREIFSSSVTGESSEKPTKTKPAPAPRTKPLGGTDFYDIETRAKDEGIRITTVGGKAPSTEADRSPSIVHKGKALFLSAIVVFFYLVAIGGVAIGMPQETYALPAFYPYVIWGAGLILLLVTGLAFANHFGEKSLRTKSLALVNALVIFVLTVIVDLIIALAIQIDFTAPHDYMTFLTIPLLALFSIVIFGVVYFVQVRPRYKKS